MKSASQPPVASTKPLLDLKVQRLLLLIAAMISGVRPQSEHSPICVYSLHSIPETLTGYQTICTLSVSFIWSWDR